MDHAFGWKPSPPDQRDYRLRLEPLELLSAVDLRSTNLFPPIWDQSRIGSCVAHGSDRAGIYALAKGGGQQISTSQLFTYYNGRSLEGTVDQDSGLYIRDGVKAIAQWGLAPESDWPYDISRFTERPPNAAYQDATRYEATVYAAVDQHEEAMKAVLASGYPIIVGFTVYESFESNTANTTGVIPMPATSEKVLSGHCMLVVGYTPDHWICANSWGMGWGDHGYCYMPTEYLTNPNLADDFWMIKTVAAPGPTPVPPTPTKYELADAALRKSLADATGEAVVTVRGRKGFNDTFKSGGLEVHVWNLHPNG